MPRVLIVDDDSSVRESLKMILEYEGYETASARDAVSGIAEIELRRPDAVLLDIKMPGMDGMEALDRIGRLDDPPPVLMISGHGDIATAVESTRRGAVDFLEKPPERERLLLSLRNALSREVLLRENRQLKRLVEEEQALVGDSPSARRLREEIARVAPSEATALITGESGTGKELVAHEIQRLSRRASASYVTVNCAAIPEELIESELFGHERGAFTGALVKRVGRIEQAHGGTLFLDEVSEMPPDLQVKFLRVLEEKRVTPVGGNESREVDFRLVAATNRDLRAEIEAGRFRQDLYYRLSVVTVEIPLLRERKDDIPLLVERFRDLFAREHGKPVIGVTPAALAALVGYAWPGNVRELKNVLESAVLFAAGTRIDVSDLPAAVRGRAAAAPAGAPAAAKPRSGEWPAVRPAPVASAEAAPEALAASSVAAPEEPASVATFVGKTMAEIEREAILTALQVTGGNRRRAAEALGIGLRTLQRKLKEYHGEPVGEDDEDLGDETGS